MFGHFTRLCMKGLRTLLFETAVSYHRHKLFEKTLRSTFVKWKLRQEFYLVINLWQWKRFKVELKEQQLSSNFELFYVLFKVTLNQLAHVNQKVLQNNNQNFVIKARRKWGYLNYEIKFKGNKISNFFFWVQTSTQLFFKHFNRALNVSKQKQKKQNNFWKLYWKQLKNMIMLTENNPTEREKGKICPIFNTYLMQYKNHEGLGASKNRKIWIFEKKRKLYVDQKIRCWWKWLFQANI